MKIIEFKNNNGQPITFTANKILGCAPSGDDKALLFMDAPEPNDYFILMEKYKEVAFRLKTEVFEA